MGAYTRTYSLTDGTVAYGSQVAFELDALGSSVNNIVNAQVSSGAAIADTKLAQITTASKVHGTSLVGLASVPAGAGVLPAANGGSVAATQAEMETATSIVVTVTPGRQHFNPCAGKMWCNFNGTGTAAINTSYNVTSLTDNGQGDYTVTIATDFSTANYAAVVSAGTTVRGYAYIEAQAAGTIQIKCADNNGASLQDQAVVNVIAMGDFA